MPDATGIEILAEVAAAWKRAGIAHAVASGLEDYPERTGRDIDVVVAPEGLEHASRIVRDVMERAGRRLVVRERRELVQHIGVCEHGGDALIVDLFPGLRWGPVWLVRRPAPSLRRAGFGVDPWVSFVKRVLLHVLVAPARKFAHAPERLALSAPEAAAAARELPRLLGEQLAQRLSAAIAARDVARLERLRPVLRRALVRRQFATSPWSALHTTCHWLRARLDYAVCPPAMPTVSIVGPDGVGKSTLITEVARRACARLRCSTVVVRHWRPGVLPPLGKLAGRPAPRAGTPPRRTAGRFSLLRVLYYGADFLVGTRLRDRPLARNLGLVIYDRGALDMYVDPLRYGLRPGWGPALLRRSLPRPGLVVLLQDHPARIRARKPELEEAEIARQLGVWRGLAAAGEVDLVLRVDATPNELAERVVDELLQRFLAVNAPAPASLGKPRPEVLVVGQTPPPYGGQALMIEQLVQAQFPSLRTRHVRMGFSDGMSSLGHVSARKLLHLGSVAWQVLGIRFRHGPRVLYYPPAGPTPAAVLRDMVLLAVLRPFFPRRIYHFHAAGLSDYLKEKTPVFRLLARAAYGRPDAAIQPSALAPADAEFFGARRLAIIPNGLPDTALPYLGADREPGARVVVLFVGAISEIKGTMLLLEAAREIASRRADFAVWFMGEFISPDYEKRVRSFCRDHALEDVVSFLGLRIGDAKWSVFRSADLLCLPSLLESFGNVLVEAMMFRLPVVATRTGGIPDIVEPGVTGCLLAEPSATELASVLESLIDDPAARERMGRAGRRRYLERFTLDVHLQRMEELLLSVASPSRPGPAARARSRPPPTPATRASPRRRSPANEALDPAARTSAPWA